MQWNYLCDKVVTSFPYKNIKYSVQNWWQFHLSTELCTVSLKLAECKLLQLHYAHLTASIPGQPQPVSTRMSNQSGCYCTKRWLRWRWWQLDMCKLIVCSQLQSNHRHTATLKTNIPTSIQWPTGHTRQSRRQSSWLPSLRFRASSGLLQDKLKTSHTQKDIFLIWWDQLNQISQNLTNSEMDVTMVTGALVVHTLTASTEAEQF